MASLDDLLFQADELISSGASSAPASSGISSSSISLQPETPKSMIGADLLGALDTGYAKTNPMAPSVGDLAYEALVPSTKAAKETVEGLVNLGKLGASTVYDYTTVDSATREARRKIEEAKQLELDIVAAKNAGISLAQYQTAKQTERKKEILDMVGSGGSQIVGGGLGALGGAKAGALTGAALGSFIPVIGTGVGAGVGGLAGALYGGYLGSGAGEVAYQKAKEGIGNYIEPGSVRELSPMELATKFSEAGTAGLVPEAGGAALKLGGKASAKTAQKLSDALGPITKDEALARAGTLLEPSFPAAKVRGRYAGQVGREQTAGMKTTAEVVGTPEAYMAEQAIGTNPLNQPLYNARIQDTAVKSQEFLLDDLTKEISAKAQPKNVSLLKQAEVTDETIGKMVKTAIDDAETLIKKEVSLEYAPLNMAEKTSTAGVKGSIFDALKEQYGTIPGKPGKTGVAPERLSKSIPKEIDTFAKEIRDPAFKNYTVGDLQRWQSRARNLIDQYGGDKDAVKALTKIREILKDKILTTKTGKAHWANATKEAKKAYDVFENHKLGKMLERERMNFADFYKAIIKEPENFKNFKAMVQENPAIMDAVKAKALSDIRNIGTAAGTDTVAATASRAKWIRNNEPWLKQLFPMEEFKRLNETALRGEAQAVRAAKTNPLGGSPTAARQVASRSGLERLLGKTEKIAQANPRTQEAVKSLKVALQYAAGGGAGFLVGGPLGTAVGIGALGLGRVGLAKRMDKASNLLREAAYDIAMNPKTAGWTAPKLAEALAKRRVGQVEKLSRVGEKTGRITGRAAQLSRLVPTEDEKRVAQQVVDNPDAYLAIDKLMEQYRPKKSGAPSTPKVVSVERKSYSSEDEAENYLSSRRPIIRAIAEAESAKDKHKSVSPKGARGRMQLMPGTAKDMGVENIDDPMENVKGGEKYYSNMEKEFKDYDKEFAIAAYNWGPGSVRNAIKKLKKSGATVTWQNLVDNIFVPTETKRYVSTVLRKERQFRA